MTARSKQTADSQVQRLRHIGCKHHAGRIFHPEQAANLLSRLINRPPRLQSRVISAPAGISQALHPFADRLDY